MYRIVVHDQAQATVDALPVGGLLAWFDVVDLLRMQPWAGEISRKENPNANILTLPFGPTAEGQVSYMVLDRDGEVHVLEVQWVG